MTTAQEVIAKAICCPNGCLRSEQDCWSLIRRDQQSVATAVLLALASAPDSVRQELAALLNPWRPIEMAPKSTDPRQAIELDLWGPPGRRAIGWWYELQSMWVWECDGEPTHWLPLPAPPKEDKE